MGVYEVMGEIRSSVVDNEEVVNHILEGGVDEIGSFSCFFFVFFVDEPDLIDDLMCYEMRNEGDVSCDELSN